MLLEEFLRACCSTERIGKKPSGAAQLTLESRSPLPGQTSYLFSTSRMRIAEDSATAAAVDRCNPQLYKKQQEYRVGQGSLSQPGNCRRSRRQRLRQLLWAAMASPP